MLLLYSVIFLCEKIRKVWYNDFMLRNITSIYLKRNNKVLLLYRVGSRVVAPSWCGIGGHFEENELNNPKKCILRELFEETGITENDICNLELRYITLRQTSGEVRQNYYYFADLTNDNYKISSCTEGTLEWMEFDKTILKLNMPYTAKFVIKHYLETGKDNKKLYSGTASPTGVEFVEFAEN